MRPTINTNLQNQLTTAITTYRFHPPYGFTPAFDKVFPSDEAALEYAHGMTDGPELASVQKLGADGLWMSWSIADEAFVPLCS